MRVNRGFMWKRKRNWWPWFLRWGYNRRVAFSHCRTYRCMYVRVGKLRPGDRYYLDLESGAYRTVECVKAIKSPYGAPGMVGVEFVDTARPMIYHQDQVLEISRT